MKTRIIATALCALMLALVSTGCLVRVEGSGQIETRDYDFHDFSRVEIGSAFDYDIIRSDSYAVSVTADDNLFEHIQVVERNGTLEVQIASKIGLFSIFNFGRSTRSVTVMMPELDGLDISGASHGYATGFESGDDLVIDLSGASTLEFRDLGAGNLDADVSGASTLTLAGSVNDVDISVSGASKLYASSLAAGETSLSLSGASSVTGDAIACGDLELELSGASSARIDGSAGDMRIDASGASTARLPGLAILNADVTLTGASTAVVEINGRLDIDLSGASSLNYTGSPSMGRVNISGSSSVDNGK